MFKNTFKAILAVEVITGNNTWYTAVVSGRFGISLSDNLEVAYRWSFKYNVKAKNSSSLKKVKAAISYEFDKTEQFNIN